MCGMVCGLSWAFCMRAPAQATIFFQGFENATIACAGENWGYTGGVRNGEARRTGLWSARVGRSGESNTLTFDEVEVTGLDGLRLHVHHSVRGGSGPGLDTREGAVFLISLDGGPWTAIGRVGGFGDHSYGWSDSPGGAAATSAGCSVYQCPNPLEYDAPPGTNRLSFKVVSVGRNSSTCAAYNTAMQAGTAYSYDRTDEGFFVDDVRLTTTTAPLPGIWTGRVGQDWADCANWSLGFVPTVTTPVRIPGTAQNDCVVGLDTPLSATCASLLHTTNGAPRQLQVRNTSSLLVGGPFTVQRTSPGTALITSVVGNSVLAAGSIEVQGVAAGMQQAILRCEEDGSEVLSETDVLLLPGGVIDLQGPGTSGGALSLGRDLIDLAGDGFFQEQNSTVRFEGNGPQVIITSGHPEVFHRLVVDKPGGDLTLDMPVEVSWELVLGRGRVNTTAAALLTLRSGAEATGGSDLAFVNGPMEKVGITPFEFPVGKGTNIRPCALSGYSGAVSDAFIAEYFPVSARSWGTAWEPTIDHISDCEYWTIDRSAGNADAIVTLTWDDPASCGVNDPASLCVAHWDGAVWSDRGNGGALGTMAGGSIPTELPQGLFGPWTLASRTNLNPLPVDMLAFTAVPTGARVRVDWTTAVERDNRLFTVERSADGTKFNDVVSVPGAGTSLEVRHYVAHDDEPLPGLSYYRLRQEDLDGAMTRSGIVTVLRRNIQDITVVRTEEGPLFHHAMPLGAEYEVFDAVGRVVLAGVVPEGPLLLRGPALARGVHVLRIRQGDLSGQARFMW